MSADILTFRKPRKPRKVTIRNSARRALTEALNGARKPTGVVIVAIGEDGAFSLRSVSLPSVQDFDMYSRAVAVIDQRRMKLMK